MPANLNSNHRPVGIHSNTSAIYRRYFTNQMNELFNNTLSEYH